MNVRLRVFQTSYTPCCAGGVTFLLHFKLCWSSGPGTKPLVTPFLLPGRASDLVSQDGLSNADRAGTGWDKKTTYVQVLGQLGFKKKKKKEVQAAIPHRTFWVPLHPM